MHVKEKQIMDFVTIGGQTGPQMTHALKVLGNGDMQQGLKRLAKYFFNDGKSYYIKLGRIQGVIGGVAGVGLVFLLLKMINDERDKSKHAEEAKAIEDAFNADHSQIVFKTN